MRSTSGLVGPSLSGRLEAYDAAVLRTGAGLLVAFLLHGGLLAYAYLRPSPASVRRSQPIVMEVLTRPKPPPPKPPEVPPPPKPPEAPPPAALPKQAASRPLPRELAPVPRASEAPDAKSSALIVPAQPPGPPEAPAPGLPKGPINLFDPKALGRAVGAPAPGAPIPKRDDILFGDKRLEEKKEPPFELVPEKGGGYKCETKNFIAHIKPDGTVSFDNRFPIGFNKGGTFSFDLTDLAMRGKKIDPYAAEKRRFMEFSEKQREELRKQALKESQERAMSLLGQQLSGIWANGSSAASRRRELYEKWADCSDEKGDGLGRKGRHAVEDFIRGHLPQGSSDAYTAEELSRIAGERQGLPPFDPYGTGTP